MEDITKKSCWKKKHIVFIITFMNYALFHASRKSFSAIKSTLNHEKWFQSSFYSTDQQSEMCGLLDTLFLGFYAIGLYISGVLGDRFDLRLLLARGTWLSALIIGAFGLGGILHIRSLGYYATLWALSGLVQSIGWPTNVAIMGNWFGPNERGATMGLWSGNSSFGNILGTAVVVMTFVAVTPSKGWFTSLIFIAILLALQGMIIYYFLQPCPRTIEESNQEYNLGTTSRDGIDFGDGERLLAETNDTKTSISFSKAWLIPGVISYSASYASLKSVNYVLFFWLPFYLTNSLHMSDSEADNFSMLYDVGQIIGGLAGGYLSDRMGVRSPVVVTFMLLASASVSWLRNASTSVSGILLVLSGCLIGGPASLISTAISADLGTHQSLHGNSRALSTVTGIIDGTGSIGASLAQYMVGYLSQCHNSPSGCNKSIDPDCTEICNWTPVFFLLSTGCILAAFCLVSLLRRDMNIVYNRSYRSYPIEKK